MTIRDDVEEFAAQLRRLKDRTDRSYGSLARRLHMNTSTLHRYCAGEAVPQDFAPVERLAAFCRATPEERLELHRLWLSALAARQRGRTAGLAVMAATAGPAVPAPAPAPAPEAARSLVEQSRGAAQPGDDPEDDPGPEDPGADRSLVAVSSAAEQPRDHPVPESPEQDEPEPGKPEPDHPVPEGAEPEVHEPDHPVPEGPEPEVHEPDHPALSPAPRHQSRPRRRPRHRRALASVAAGCALLAAVGITSALPDGRSPEADASRSAGPGTAAPGAPHRSAEPSAATSPAAAPSSARSGPRQTATAPSATTPSATGGDPASAAGPAGGTPLTWSADSQVWDGGCGHDYVIDKPPAQVPPPPVQQDAGAWAATQGAVHGRQTMVQISVQGRSSTAVVLEALRVRVVGRGDPAAGSAYAMDQGCGGDLAPRRFTVNLDADRPVARPKDGADSEHTLPAVHFPYRVSAEDPEVLLVDATTHAYDARWYLELDWSSQGRTGTIRIDAHGRPFRTTAVTGMPRYWYGTSGTGRRAWVPYSG